MATVKTILLYNRRRLQPATINAIAAAKDGDMIEVDESEIGQIDVITIFSGEVDRVRGEVPGAKPAPKARKATDDVADQLASAIP